MFVLMEFLKITTETWELLYEAKPISCLQFCPEPDISEESPRNSKDTIMKDHFFLTNLVDLIPEMWELVWFPKVWGFFNPYWKSC